ncbi:hypothetical protein E1A91_A09G087900v1 [Gossypium mustelinum]|uniref:Protein EARLY FLOWERING 3 n=2 Tax=Gossypium mustelinum TaxID=34275 RepID=A0A5D2XVU9_GOSMU|nr:hypothetical protein E1A91_A09G087900v1 [Gossypium mustelinum]TYJ17944.1 hypothetical protein E1A91_A09G087900v1 [Gossypium mustelinum]
MKGFEKMMMKGGKDEAKVMNPMFPRLHVNDAEKGGPKAPPRNKMALYEQLSITSQRFNSGSQSMLPFPPNNSNILVPSMSSSHGGGNERNMFMPLANSHESSVLADEKFNYCSIPGTKLSTMKGNQDRKSSKTTKCRSFDPLQPLHFSKFKKFSYRSVGLDDDLTVPTSILPGMDRNHGCSKQSEGRERFSKSNLSSSMQFWASNKKQMKENGRLCENSQDLMERSNSIVSTRDEILAGTSLDLSTKIKNPGSLKRPHAVMNQENKSITVDVLNSNDVPDARLICSRQSLGVDNENRNLVHEEKTHGATEVEGVNRHNNVPDASEYISASDICPDDVVEIIGEKHFWKVRRAIANQQRVFSVQVFELHRLIKVQRLIAGSPHMLFEDTFHIDKPSFDVSAIKKLSSDDVPQPPLISKVKSNSRKPDTNIECANDNAFAELPCASANDETKGLVIHQPKYESYSGNAFSTLMTANSGLSPWCVSPPGNQWLVPIMSPSEGLVYKPYTWPIPPTAGLLTPVYGSCGTVNLGVSGRDFLNTAKNLAASHQHDIEILRTDPPISQTTFPHYGMPVMNPSVTGSALEQMSLVIAVQSKANFTMAQPSSCNTSSQPSQAISYSTQKLPAPNETEIQGTTASSPSERAKVDALPLFPTEPPTTAANCDARTHQQRTKVIKVIPHNHVSATESAARIFQSIQEERKQYD